MAKQESSGPELLVRGAFSIYSAPDGGLHVAVRLEGEDQDRHVPVPPMMLRMVPGGREAIAQMLGKREG